MNTRYCGATEACSPEIEAIHHQDVTAICVHRTAHRSARGRNSQNYIITTLQLSAEQRLLRTHEAHHVFKN